MDFAIPIETPLQSAALAALFGGWCSTRTDSDYLRKLPAFARRISDSSAPKLHW